LGGGIAGLGRRQRAAVGGNEEQRRPGRGGGASPLVARATKVKTGRQVACSKTFVAKPEHADQVAEMLQAVVREHYGPLSTPPPRRRPAAAADLAALAAAPAPAAADGAADAAAAPAAAALVDPDLPRLLSFSAERDQWDRHVFHVWMQAASNEALGKIDTAPRAVAFMREAAPLLERPVGMLMYTFSPDGTLGAAAVQGGPKGEGGLDDATGASGMVGAGAGGQTSAALAAMVAQAMNEHGAEAAAGEAGKRGAEGGLPAALKGVPSAAVAAGAAAAVAVAAAAAWWFLGGGSGGAV